MEQTVLDFWRTLILYLHLGAGALSLVLFWVPIFSAKGAQTHRKIGRYYIKLMWVVVITAIVLCVFSLMSKDITKAVFLGFLVLLTANPLWHGVAILKEKRTVSSHYRTVSLAYEFALGLAGLGLIVYAIFAVNKNSLILLVIFGFLGLLSLPKAIVAWRTPPDKIEWMAEHIQNMCVTGIAAYTAFFAFGGRELFTDFLPGTWVILPWLLPTVIGLIGTEWALRQRGLKKMKT